MKRFPSVIHEAILGAPEYTLLLVRDPAHPYRAPARKVATPQEVADLFPKIHQKTREVFYAIWLNTKNDVIGIHQVCEGTLNACTVHPREVYRGAVQAGAAYVIMCHNHPSGDPTPSGADIQLTRRLARAGDALGIELLDHVVLGDTSTSLRETGLM